MRLPRASLCLALLAVSLPSLAAVDEPGATWSWLERMSRSQRELNYQGIVTYQVGEQLSSFRVRHQFDQGRELESLEPLDAELQPLRHRYDTGRQHTSGKMLGLAVSQHRRVGLPRFYQLEQRGERRQAGRKAVELLVQPRDIYRYGYRLILDAQTGLLLRNDILSHKGDPLERFQYVMLELDASPANGLPAAAYTQRHSRSHDEASLDWQPSWIPAGFSRCESRPDDANSQSYTDGLAVLSIFVEPLPRHYRRRDTGMRHGASVSYSVVYPQQQALVTVVGEVPLITAKEVAQSLRWK